MVNRRREAMVKASYYFLLLLLFCGLETAVFPRFFPLRHVPMLLPFWAAAIAVYDGEAPGVMAGVAAGFLLDGATEMFPYYTVFLLAAGGVIGASSPSYFKKRVPPAMVWGAGVVLVSETVRFFVFLYLTGRTSFAEWFSVVLPRTFFSLLFSSFWVGPVFWIRRFFRREQRFYR